MILMPICNSLYLLFITTYILHQFCESKDIKVKRSAAGSLGFIDDYYRRLKLDTGQFPFVHEYRARIYSKASESNLRILGKKRIDSLGTMESPDSILVIENAAFGVIRIRGERSGLYLCMNKRGNLVARAKRNSKQPRCAFIVEDDHPKAYKRYLSLAFQDVRISFNKNGRPRTRKRVKTEGHRSVLFVERRLNNEPASTSMRTRRHGLRKMHGPCREQNKKLLQKEYLRLWTIYCLKRRLKKSTISQR